MRLLILALCLSTGIVSCHKDDNGNVTNNSTLSVNEFLRNLNGLKIIKLIEEGNDKTSLFSPYLFRFRENGAVVASKTGENINGTYLVFRDDNRIEIRMTFPNNTILFELNDDWYFISQNENVIIFEDNGDIVQFEKQ